MSLPLLTGDARDEEKYDIERDDPYRKLHDYFRYLHDFWRYVRDNHDSDPIVVNSQDLVRDPAAGATKVLRADGTALQRVAPAMERLYRPFEEVEVCWANHAAGFHVVFWPGRQQ